ILRYVENFELSLGKLNNPVPHFWILGAYNDLTALDVPWTSRSDRLAITFSRHDARMVRLVGDVGLCVPDRNGPCAHELAFVRSAAASKNQNDDQAETKTDMHLSAEKLRVIDSCLPRSVRCTTADRTATHRNQVNAATHSHGHYCSISMPPCTVH